MTEMLQAWASLDPKDAWAMVMVAALGFAALLCGVAGLAAVWQEGEPKRRRRRSAKARRRAHDEWKRRYLRYAR